MTRYFFDTSAVTKLFVAESGTEAMMVLFEQTGDRFRLFSALTPLELRSALRRRTRDGDLPEGGVNAALQVLAEEMQRAVQMPLTQGLLQRAHEVVDTYGLRAGDAIQLACALAFVDSDQDPITLVSSDRELLSAASQAGLSVYNPES